ncbi:sensor histidine kinase [Nonomuraea endophytica]|uniref:histidine kinase n=1 Tax=Nonomuraea endophytica TaxID=714136 RepID=A0A7W8ACE7_9ACTN|nr:histidine kinase [Nonomuraea endophytica]MBB5083074.1 signal transduction histidine kinase [Nonomuraea endophytica]
MTRPDLTGSDRRTLVLASCGAAVLCAIAQVLLFAGSGQVAELVVNLLVDVCLLGVVRLPRTVGTLTLAATAALAMSTGATQVFAPVAAPLVVSFLVYLLPWRQAFAFAAALALLAIPIWAPTWTALYFSLSATALPAVVALWLKTRYELVRSLRRRAELADAERHLLAERAEVAERRRLAAEMHDIVTHHVTEIVLNAEALRVTARDEPVRTAADQIRRAGARTLNELRELMQVVAGDELPGKSVGGRPPDRDTGGDLAELVSGEGVTLSVSGDAAEVPAVVARAAYRVVQESLTNARKHAPGAPVTVTLSYRGDRVEVEVHNQPPHPSLSPSLAATGSGMGLIGLRRRVTLLGGVFAAEDDGQGGFVVSATIPTDQRP